MKEYNAKYDVVLNIFINPAKNGAKDGEMVEHSKRVQNIVSYYPINDKYQTTYIQAFLSRDMILDLAEQIKKTESETVMANYDSLPF